MFEYILLLSLNLLYYRLTQENTFLPLFLGSKKTMTKDTAKMSYFVVLHTSSNDFS